MINLFKNKIHYKIIILLTLIMLFVCWFTGCQSTPEENIVIQKDNFEELIYKTAQPTNNDESQTVQVDNHIIWENEYIKKYPGGSSSKIQINVNTYIDTAPKKGSVYLVDTRDYDLSFSKRAVDFFIGNEYYNGVFTKKDLLLKILPIKQSIQNMDQYSDKGNLESFLNILERQYERAPENNSPGDIEFKDEWYNAVLDQSIDYLCVKGYPYDGAVSELYVGNGSKAYTNFYYVVQDGTREYQDIRFEYSGAPARGMNTSYEDARSIAEDAIVALYGEKMAHVQTDLCNARLNNKYWGDFNRGLLNNSCPQCYVFTFTPIYGGLSQLYAPEASNYDDVTYEGVNKYEQKWDYEYSMKWPAHYVHVYVDDNGIVEFYEFSPAEIVENVNNNVAMLPFDKIFEKFKKDIFYCSVWSENSSISEINITIDSIKFGMVRVPVKDNPDTYYMIPAWQFAGSKEELSVDRSGYSESGKTFLVLNALDGSIIDTSYYINFKRNLVKTIGRDKD